MFTITVKYDEKKSTTSQYENVMAGVLIERSHLELHTPEELLQKTSELFALARTAVRRELNSRDHAPSAEPVEGPRRALPRPAEPAPQPPRDRGPGGPPSGRRPRSGVVRIRSRRRSRRRCCTGSPRTVSSGRSRSGRSASGS